MPAFSRDSQLSSDFVDDFQHSVTPNRLSGRGEDLRTETKSEATNQTTNWIGDEQLSKPRLRNRSNDFKLFGLKESSSSVRLTIEGEGEEKERENKRQRVRMEGV